MGSIANPSTTIGFESERLKRGSGKEPSLAAHLEAHTRYAIMSDTTMKLKLHRVDGSLEVRRVGLQDRAATMEALHATVDATFPDLEGKYALLYVDADGDTCTLKTDEELAISFIARA